MTATVLLWVLGPTAVFLSLSLYVAFMGLRTRDLKFRTRTTDHVPAPRRQAWLVNVVTDPAGERPAGRPGT